MSVRAKPRSILAADEFVEFAIGLAGTRSHPGPRLDLTRSRGYEEIWSDDYVNAWLIHWSGDADTGFHDHDASSAGIHVLDGAVIEERLALDGPPIARRFCRGDSFCLAPSAIHRVRHGEGIPALTIHAYSPPLRVQGVYRVGPDGALERDAMPYTQELQPQPGAP